MNSFFKWLFTDSGENPYQSPQGGSEQEVVEANRLSREEKHRAIGQQFWRWEKLRIVYNAVLAVEVLVLTSMFAVTAPDSLQKIITPRFIEQVVLGCLAANLFFLLGHYINGYLVWLGFRQPVYTMLIFLGGLVIAVGLTALAIASMLFEFGPNG